MTEKQITDLIRSEQKKQGLTDREFARRAKMGNLSKMYNGIISPRIDTILRMLDVLGLKVEVKQK